MLLDVCYYLRKISVNLAQAHLLLKECAELVPVQENEAPGIEGALVIFLLTVLAQVADDELQGFAFARCDARAHAYLLLMPLAIHVHERLEGRLIFGLLLFHARELIVQAAQVFQGCLQYFLLRFRLAARQLLQFAYYFR